MTCDITDISLLLEDIMTNNPKKLPLHCVWIETLQRHKEMIQLQIPHAPEGNYRFRFCKPT